MGPLWRRVFLFSLLWLGLLYGAVSDDIGGSIYYDRTISLSGSPYDVTDDIIVGESATLTVEAGVRLLFPEGVGMTVLGRLIAEGTPDNRIVFDRKWNPPDDQANNVTRDHDIRLLGPTVFEGRVQVRRDGVWGSLCLQNRGWRSSEATVVCRQLGFAGGRVDSRYRYGTGRMAVCGLECRGNEDNIYQCNHDNLDQPPQCQTGRNRNDLGVVCEGIDNRRGGVYWKGLEIVTTDPSMYSVIENVDVLHGSSNASIAITSVSPKLHNVVVKYSRQAAIHVINPSTPLQMSNCHISDNHGVGLLVDDPSQNITVSSTTFARNFPAGMHVTGAESNAVLSINTNTFTENSGAGLMLSDAAMKITVNGSMFNANTHHGLSISSNSVPNLEMDGCRFDHNGLDGVHIRYTSVSSEPSITVMRNSGADRNGGRGVDLEISYPYSNSVPFGVDQVDISGSEFLGNAGGSVKVTVDGSDENRYPDIQVTDCMYRNNSETVLEVSGTCAELTVENGIFESNKCGSKPVIHIHGFEKKIRLTANSFVRNHCKRVGLYNTTNVFLSSPPTEIVGNIFDNNEYNPPSHAYVSEPLSEFCTLEFSGSMTDSVNVTGNSFQSEAPRFEICSNGQDTGLGVTLLQASLNWWGTTDPASIANKIFDYDDWNNGAIVTFVPYLNSPSGTPINSEYRPGMSGTQLGGRVFNSLRLTTANSPYTITKDLTILPNASLIIDPGVDIQIQERVGILNLGHMDISGTPDNPVNFNLTTRSHLNRTGVLRLQDGSSESDGRLEVYHHGQWMCACSERVGEFKDIACRQLGFGSSKSTRGIYSASTVPKVTIRCEGHEEILEECSFYHTTSCNYCTGLTCERTPGWGGVLSYSSELVNISNINLQYVGHLHHRKASALSVQYHPSNILLTEIRMTDFALSQSGIELWNPKGEVTVKNVTMERCVTEAGISVLDPQQSVTIHNVDLTNTGSEIDAGVSVKKLSSLSWSNLEEQVSSRVVPFQSIYGGPPIITLRPGLGQWLVNGITRGVKSSGLKHIQVPDGYLIQITLTKSQFNYPPSDNSLTVFDSNTRNESRVLGTVDYYNDDSSGTRSRVFTSSGSVLTLHIKAEKDRYSLFLAEVKAVADTAVHSSVSMVPKTLIFQELSLTDFASGVYIDIPSANIHIEGSTFRSCSKGTHVGNTAGDKTIQASSFVQNTNGIVISSSPGDIFISDVSTENNYDDGVYLQAISGNVTLTNVSALDNNGNGIRLYSITGTVVTNSIEVHSNDEHGLYLQNVYGTSSLSDVTATGNGASSYAGVYIYHSSSSQGSSYNIANLTSEGNRGYGVRLELRYKSYVHIFNSDIQENLRGGVLVNIAYYQQGQIPHITMFNSTVANNKRIALQALGQLANFEISGNSITQNSCPYHPAVTFQGQPKYVNFSSNNLSQNNARETLSVLFEDQSRYSERVGVFVEDNVFQGNFYSPSETDGNFQYGSYPDLDSCTIEIGGYKENYSLTHNFIDSPNMNYTLCSRVGTTFPDEAIDARYNWWGTADEQQIRNKIVDYDAWNDRAPVEYFPYLTGPDITSLPAQPPIRNITMTTDNIGGRLYEAMHLTKVGSPYTIKKDLTVMENASVTVEPGVRIGFHPCVGIFNLGSFVAVGTETEQIEFHSDPSAAHQYQVRLADGRYPWEGRVEILHNNQWGAICYYNYYWGSTEANVVCRELGFGAATTVRTTAFGGGPGPAWFQSRYTRCTGDELSIFNCLSRSPSPNSCSINRHIGIRCNPETPVSPRLRCTSNKWGGIRSKSSQEFKVDNAIFSHTGRLHVGLGSALHLDDSETSGSISNIQVQECEGTGIYVVAKYTSGASNVTVRDCHGEAGITLERANRIVTVTKSLIYNNTFYEGAIAIIATPITSSTEVTTVPADTRCGTPITFSNSSGTFASPNFGSSSYPSYSYCEWVIRAPVGHVVLLDFSVLDLSYNTEVKVYDGQDSTASSIATYRYSSSPGDLIGSTGNSMFVVFRSRGYSGRGFLAKYEIDLPPVYRIVDNIVKDNSGTAVKVTAQSSYSIIDVLRNIFENNQERETNNDEAVIIVNHERSNTVVRGNVMQNNQMTSIRVNVQRRQEGNVTVTDNLFRWNSRSTTLTVRGQYYASGQTPVRISNNVFSGNDATETGRVLYFYEAPGTVENNTFVNNSARHVIDWEGLYYSEEQVLSNNFIYDNIPLTPGMKYTIAVSGRNTQIHGNVFTNPANDAELATSTRTSSYPVNATGNFWGFDSDNLVSERIRDKDDNDDWAEVLYDPWLAALPADGPCPLGWKYSKQLSACYMYHSGAQDWLGAVHSCKIQHAIVARSFSGQERELIDSIIRAREVHFVSNVPIWKDRPDDIANSTHDCKVHLPSNGTLTTLADCGSFYPFICKRPVVDDCPNACSHRGRCEGRTCICDRGWEGEDCSKANCRDRNDCGEFGTCVGPNICRCRNGWQGRACTVSYCNRFTSCKSCAMAVGCGWCDQRQSCESGLYRGPDVMPCQTWFYHSCFTVGEKGRCSPDIEVVDCEHRQCNNSLSTTTVESCLRCQDVEGCFKETDNCKVWNEDQCPKGFIHPLYNDTTRIEKILIGHNVEYVPREGNTLYRCPVRFSSWGATMFVNEGILDIRIGQVLSSPQASGVLHKVEQVRKTEDYTVIVAHPATLEDMLDYSDFSQEVQLEMAVDMKRNEGVPELSVVERVLNGNGTLDGSAVRVIAEDVPVYKCIGSRAMNEGEGNYHLLMTHIPDHLSVGDIIVSNHSNGILEQVIQQTTTTLGVFIQTQLQDCFEAFNFRQELQTTDGTTLPASLPCSGGPEGAHGLLIVDSNGKELDLETGDAVVGRKSSRLLAKVVNVTTSADYTLVEAEPILSRSMMTLPSRRRRREDVAVSPDREPLNMVVEEQFREVTDRFDITLSTSGALSAGIKLSLAVSTSEFSTPTLKKAEASFIGGRLEVGLHGSLDVSERTWTRGGFQTTLPPRYASLCVSSAVCIPAKIWADIETSYEIYAQGPGSIEMSSNVVKPDIDGGGSWQPQEGSQSFSFEQNEESNDADVLISSYSGTASESDQLIILELKVKPTFSIEFPTSGESEEDANVIPSLDEISGQIGQGDAFGYIITTSLQSQALLRVSAQSCSAECPYSDRPQYVGVTSSLDYLKGAFNVVVGNNEYYEEQQWRREEWMESDRNCKAQPSSIDTCEEMCLCSGVATGRRHPTDDSFCMCPCDCESGNISFTHPDISDGDGCNCDLCPNGDFKTVNSQGHLHCPCLCPDNSTSELTSNGKCDCSCLCPDGSSDVVLSDGSCPCRCTCNNCHESVLGPQGCICSDSCPDCENDEEPEWQDCVCRCPQKTECGIPPTCVVGRMGPDCRQPDCRPCQGCSGNGRCTTSTDSCQSSCVCWPQWFGDCCELRRPRPVGGDPHLQTLDGISYDYHGIGEFWDCKSVPNDFGVQTRMYAYERASLIGGVAVKAGHSVVTLMTLPNATEKDVPSMRIDGELCQLSVGEKYLLNNGTIHLLAQQPSTNATESGAVIIVSITFASGATVSFDVRYSPKMGRQFVNILFSPTATFKGTTEGLCGLMDDDDANDFTGPDGTVYNVNDSSVFAETWRINQTHYGSGLMGSWSWNSSNFHPDDVMDPAYSDPAHRPSVGIDGLTQEQKEKAEEMCIALGLTGILLNECIFDVSITNDTTFTEQEAFKGCPNQCSGRGRCVNGTCDCITGWSGEDCNLGNCTDCSEDHGRCELGFCRCEPGWEGAACDQQATCDALRNCTSKDHGICIGTNVCRCKPGYIGDDCIKVPTCGNVANCTDHGVCVDYDTCLCDEQWTGDKCDQFSCAALDHCSGHGRCVDIDVCYCEQGWTGSSCVTPDCPAVNQCSRQGDCIGPNVCQCYSGYQGLNCSQTQSCPELQECNENGACVTSSGGQKECRCFSGFSGTSCDHPDCTEQNNCTNHGSCIEPNLCQCDSGYTGNDCASFSCEALLYCSGHGRCAGFDTCSCDPGWSGGSCNIANCSSKGDCSSQGNCVAPNTCECFPGFQGDDCSEENLPNENPPIFQQDIYAITIPENQPVGTAIVTVLANDTDSGRNGEVRYRLVQTGLGDESFTVHPTLGIITSVVEFDFESLGQDSFSLIVEAFDHGVPTLTGTATLIINVTDQNDNKPVINIPPNTEYNLQTTTPVGFHVTTVQASDADRSYDNSRITYGIASVSPLVSIDATNGSVTVRSALVSGTHIVRISASDHGSPPKTDERSIRVIVTNVSTNTAPQCPEDQTLEISSRNLTAGLTIATIEAEDHDNGANGDVSYSFKSKTGQWASLFSVDQSTGRIYVDTDSVPQFSDPFSAVSMTVEVRDNAVDSMSCETNVVVIITSPGFSGTVPDNVFPTTTPQATTPEPQTTPFDRSTAGYTTQPDITTEGLENSTAFPTTERATTEVLPIVVEARSFNGFVKIVNRDWKEELRDTTSDEFKALAAEVEQGLDNVFGHSDLGDAYDSVDVTSFSSGSINVEFMVRFKAPVSNDTVLAVLSGKTNIGDLEIDDTVTSITGVTEDKHNAAWYNDPIYISVICVGAAVFVTIIVVLVICCATKSRRKPTPRRKQWPSERVQQSMLIPRAKLSREPARQMYQNPVYSINE